MAAGGKIRVLIVDDSLMQREALARGLSTDPDIEIVAKAADAYDARDKIIQFRPDVMTCDIQMPKMDGIEFIRRLIPQYPIPVIVVSSVSEAVFEALQAGAVEFIVKPSMQPGSDMKSFIEGLKAKIKIAATAKVRKGPVAAAAAASPAPSVQNSKKMIAIGASTGGTEALFSILKELPPTLPGIVIVQHIPPVFSKMFAERLDRQTSLRVKEAETGDYVTPGSVLIAPGNMHMAVHKLGAKYSIECFVGDKVSGHCPSVDVLFKSVAKDVGKDAVGVLLTGMGSDGAKGLLEMKNAGAYTIGQNERSSVVYGMPRIAFELGGVVKQAELSAIAGMLCAL